MPHKIEKLLLDLRLSCEEIIQFTRGKSFEEYSDNRILQLAIEREFEIVGEALNRLERIDLENLAQKIPEYRRIIGFRNLLAHGYDQIDDQALWDFVQNRVPKLLEKIRDY